MSDAEAWRVAVLDEHTAGTGLFQGVRCAFAVANYWTYGYFEPRDHCELPGLLLRTRASAEAPHVFFAPGVEDEPYRYHPERAAGLRELDRRAASGTESSRAAGARDASARGHGRSGPSRFGTVSTGTCGRSTAAGRSTVR